MMRAAWLGQLFRSPHASGRGTEGMLVAAPSERHRDAERRGMPGGAVTATPAPTKKPRLCLGIGDGTLHTQ